MVNVLACFDDFKGTLGAAAAGEAAARAIEMCEPGAATVRNVPLSDGGGGFLRAMRAALGLTRARCSVRAPRGSGDISVEYGVSAEEDFAVVEVAAAAGLALLKEGERDPRATSSYGVGQLLAHAVRIRTVNTVYVGLGGSCTNDAGLGALQALGLAVKVDGRWRDASSPPLTGADLSKVQSMRVTDALRRALAGKHVVLVTDVTNPLVGEHGATRVYGPQKGARTPEVLAELEAGVRRCGEAAQVLAKAALHRDVNVLELPGGGAAGGMGALFHALLGAELRGGAAMVADLVGLEAHVAWADFVVTGEGSYDEQTLSYGKTLSVVDQLCRKHNKKLVVVCGQFATGPVAPMPREPSSAMGDTEGQGQAATSAVQKQILQPANDARRQRKPIKIVLPLTPRFSRAVAMQDAARCIERVLVLLYQDIVDPSRAFLATHPNELHRSYTPRPRVLSHL